MDFQTFRESTRDHKLIIQHDDGDTYYHEKVEFDLEPEEED